jgi:hypothetical protein
MRGHVVGGCHVGALQDVLDVFMLCQDKAGRSMMYFKTKKITQGAKILYRKFSLELSEESIYGQ